MYKKGARINNRTTHGQESLVLLVKVTGVATGRILTTELVIYVLKSRVYLRVN